MQRYGLGWGAARLCCVSRVERGKVRSLFSLKCWDSKRDSHLTVCCCVALQCGTNVRRNKITATRTRETKRNETRRDDLRRQTNTSSSAQQHNTSQIEATNTNMYRTCTIMLYMYILTGTNPYRIQNYWPKRGELNQIINIYPNQLEK